MHSLPHVLWRRARPHLYSPDSTVFNVSKPATHFEDVSIMGRDIDPKGFPDGVELDGSAVIGPVQKGLSLTGPAFQVAMPAVFFELRNMTLHSFPSLDLAFVIL